MWCNGWRRTALAAKFLHGEDSYANAAIVKDGLANVFSLAETTAMWPCDIDKNTRTKGMYYWAFVDYYTGPLVPGAWNGTGINAWGYPGYNNASFGGSSPCYNPSAPNPMQPLVGQSLEYASTASLHPGGCHFAMADGSVRFTTEDTPASLLRQLSLIADGNSPIID
jgi:prepilin-type processing-associated H-X9-DG protein